MPAVKPGCFELVFRGSTRLVKSDVRGMFQPSLSETFVVVHGSIADQLNLRNTRDSLEVWVEDRFLGRFSFVVAMSVRFRMGIEELEISLNNGLI